MVIGETFLNETIIDEENPESIKDCLWRTYKKENMKVLAMNCMGMRGLLSYDTVADYAWICAPKGMDFRQF